MPELPEAEVVTRQISSRLTGGRLAAFWVGRPDIVGEGLHTTAWYRNSLLVSVRRYGKSVAMEFRNENETRFIVAELGMTGLLLFRSVPIKYPQHVHARLSFTEGREPELCYWNPRRFGRLYLLDRAGLEHYCRRRFGCDPLTVSLDEFLRLMKGRRGRLKSLLMHQQHIAGIGNIYANEILFRAGLHPHQSVGRLSRSKLEDLYRVMQEVLRDAIVCGGSSVRDFFAPDGTEGQFKHRHLVYGKDGRPCPNECGWTISRLRSERSSFVCLRCQRRIRSKRAGYRHSLLLGQI